MTNTTTARSTSLRRQMAALTQAQPTETLVSAWVAAITARESATGDQLTALSVAVDTMSAELIRRGVSQDTLDTALWVVQMNATS